MADVNIPAEGRIGSEPPPDAPRTPTAPLQHDAGAIVVFDRETHQPTGEVVSPADRARDNERTLEPLTYGRKPGDVVAPNTVASPLIKDKAVDGLDPFYARKAEHDAAILASTPPMPPRGQFPAASNSDSPSRGIPRAINDPGKAITGGFGAPPSEYFALNGHEVLQVLDKLLSDVCAEAEKDLRFTISTTYPRIKIKVAVTIECAVQQAPVEIERVFVHDKTPLAVAEQFADTACFVIVKQRQEADAEGHPLQPADAIREELHIVGPRKHMTSSENGQAGFLADVTFAPMI